MAQKRLVIGDLRGGRNGGDPPFALADNQCVEAMNVDYWGATFAHKRLGATQLSNQWGGAGGPFTGYISNIFPVSKWAPIGGVSWAVNPWLVTQDTDNVMGCVRASQPYTTYAVGSNSITGDYVTAAEYRGVLYLCGASAGNIRTWVIEHTLAETFTMRPTGLKPPASAPTAANAGSGSYAATLRYYKVAFTLQRSGTTVLRSELSAALSFTPSGSGASVTVTKPATTSEGETHWELYGSADGTVYRLLATTAVGTATYSDSTAPSSYSGDAPPTVGSNTVPAGYKYVAVHGNRLMYAGNHVATQPQSRVWFTPVWGASDVGDSERIPLENYVDLDESDGDKITGIAGNFMGAVYVFKYQQIWKLIPTGDDDAPFQRLCLTKELGCIEHKTLVVGEDEFGSPALYFLSHRGPMRITASSGIQYLGRDVEDIWAIRSIDASQVAAHAVYYNQKSQLWVWLSTSSGAYPNIKLVFDVRLGRAMAGGVRGGWTRHGGASASAWCSAIWNPENIVNVMSERVPVVGYGAAVNVLLKCDTGTQDYGSSFQAYVTTKPYTPGGLGVNCSILQSHLLAKATAGSSVSQTIVRDYGLEYRTSSVDLTPSASETRVLRQFEGSDMAGAGCVQFTIGDASASGSTWTIDALVVPYTEGEQR